MSGTVILSTTAARQRPQSKESIIMSGVKNMTAAGAKKKGGVASVEENVKASTTTDMVKDLVRDNRRLVKDLMALLAIREATKDTTIISNGTAEQEGHNAIPCCPGQVVPVVKNRPGNDGGDRVIALRAVGGGPPVGTKANAVAAAVASLLHHTATKEFSSLAGEMIAIADDSNEREVGGSVLGESGEDCTSDGDETDPIRPVMLHADAAAADANTNGTEATGGENIPEPIHPAVVKEKEEEHEEEKHIPSGMSNATPGDAMVHSAMVGVFPSGSVPVHTPRAGTPLFLPSLASSAQSCDYCMSGVPLKPVPTAELTLEQKLDKLLDSVVKIKADMHRRIDRLGRRVEQIHLDVQLNIDSTDRALLRNDLLLIGIPYREREDLQHLFRQVCRALEYPEDDDIPQVDIRRQRPARRHRNSQPGHRVASCDQNVTKAAGERQEQHPAPIVVEFMFKTLRDQFYRAYQAKRVLRLSDVGFSSERRFFVNEVLTRYNQKLMGEAVRRKRAGLLHSVYTVDGVVYVQRAAGEKGTKVTTFTSMN